MMEWFQNLALRERQFILFGTAIVVLLLSYVLVYEPLEDGLKESQVTLGQKRAEHMRLVDISHKYKQLRPLGGKSTSNDNRSLLAIIDQSSSVIGIKASIKRLTPEGKNKVRVRVEDVAFDKLVEWLVTNATKNLIHAELFLVRPTDKKGMVNATLLLSKQ